CDFNPVGVPEHWCVDQMIAAAWRLQRVPWCEAGLLRRHMVADPAPLGSPPPMVLDACPTEDLAGALAAARVPGAIPSAAALRRQRRDARAYQRAAAGRDRDVARAARQRARRENDLGRAFGLVEADQGLAKLARYQAKL